MLTYTLKNQLVRSELSLSGEEEKQPSTVRRHGYDLNPFEAGSSAQGPTSQAALGENSEKMLLMRSDAPLELRLGEKEINQLPAFAKETAQRVCQLGEMENFV